MTEYSLKGADLIIFPARHNGYVRQIVNSGRQLVDDNPSWIPSLKSPLNA